MITKFESRHVDAVAKLHHATLTGMLCELGKPAIRAFYSGAAESELAIAYVFENQKRVLGFVFGSADAGALRKQVTKKRFFSTCLGTAAGLVRNPGLAVTMFNSWRNRGSTFDRQVAELIYLAVDTNSRSGGVGRALVEAFGVALKKSGVDAYELSVDSGNHAAIAFYERLGFTEVGRYREFGADHVRYRIVPGAEQ